MSKNIRSYFSLFLCDNKKFKSLSKTFSNIKVWILQFHITRDCTVWMILTAASLHHCSSVVNQFSMPNINQYITTVVAVHCTVNMWQSSLLAISCCLIVQNESHFVLVKQQMANHDKNEAANQSLASRTISMVNQCQVWRQQMDLQDACVQWV